MDGSLGLGGSGLLIAVPCSPLQGKHLTRGSFTEHLLVLTSPGEEESSSHPPSQQSHAVSVNIIHSNWKKVLVAIDKPRTKSSCLSGIYKFATNIHLPSQQQKGWGNMPNTLHRCENQSLEKECQEGVIVARSKAIHARSGPSDPLATEMSAQIKIQQAAELYSYASYWFSI